MKRETMDLAGVALVFMLVPCRALAFDSGSTGLDGDLTPPVSTEIPLPPSGVLNYRSVNIPAGVTVTFTKNATNTPVVMLVQGEATIAGNIVLDGASSPPTGREGDGNLTDDGLPGKGGPGGFDGGYGGLRERGRVGGDGLGPGGGRGGNLGEYGFTGYPLPTCGGGAGFLEAGGGGGAPYNCRTCYAPGGAPYGNAPLNPLVGGSGGGGGASGDRFRGSGGGGGGGALLLAATGTVNLTGRISARGGTSGNSDPDGDVAAGGAGGSGGIRIVATRLSGNGIIDVQGRSSGGLSGPISTPGGITRCFGGGGSSGRIRLESEVYAAGAVSTPGVTASIGTPSALFLASRPSLRFISIGGLPVPESPTGVNDVTIPPGTPDAINVVLGTVNVPVGSVARVMLVPQVGPAISIDSTPTAGTTESASTNVSLNIPNGASVLQASVTYTILGAIGDALSRFAQGERVEKVTLTSTLGQGEKATLHTVAGRQFEVEPALLKLAALLQ